MKGHQSWQVSQNRRNTLGWSVGKLITLASRSFSPRIQAAGGHPAQVQRVCTLQPDQDDEDDKPQRVDFGLGAWQRSSVCIMQSARGVCAANLCRDTARSKGLSRNTTLAEHTLSW